MGKQEVSAIYVGQSTRDWNVVVEGVILEHAPCYKIFLKISQQFIGF